MIAHESNVTPWSLSSQSSDACVKGKTPFEHWFRALLSVAYLLESGRVVPSLTRSRARGAYGHSR